MTGGASSHCSALHGNSEHASAALPLWSLLRSQIEIIVNMYASQSDVIRGGRQRVSAPAALPAAPASRRPPRATPA